MFLKSITLKLAPLLAQFLYSHKRLDLVGIGSFFLDPAAVPDTEPGKSLKSITSEGISFENNPSIRESTELIGYISSQTGKMKALASADLNSFLELGLQFLNIGKPFLLEGIGTLSKIRSGMYEFKPGSPLPEKLKDISTSESHTANVEDNFGKYEPFLEKEKIKTAWKKPVLALLIVLGIGLAVLGGYTIYKRNIHSRNTALTASKKQTVTPILPDNTQPAAKDSLTSQAAAINSDGNYKFVLETAGKKRAFERYQKLKTYRWDVKMETNDSMQYKLFLLLPTLAMDTSRVMDSLTALNGRKVYIEN